MFHRLWMMTSSNIQLDSQQSFFNSQLWRLHYFYSRRVYHRFTFIWGTLLRASGKLVTLGRPKCCLQHTWTTGGRGQLFRRCLRKLNNYQTNLSWETRGKTASDWAKISNTRWVCLFPTLLVFDYYSVAITLNMGNNLVPVKIQQTGVIITFTWQPTWFIPIGNKWAKDIFQRC